MSRIYPYAGFWRRAVALMIDSFIVSIPCTVVYAVIMGALALRLGARNTPAAEADVAFAMIGSLMLMQVLVAAIFWLYFALMESGKSQATLGKKIMGIKVVGADGGRISFARATGRTFGKYLSYMILNFGYYMAGYTKKRQALHDLMADTFVVRDTFQPGEEKPALAFSVGGLIASIFAALLPIIITVASLVLLFIFLPENSSSQSPADLKRKVTVTQAKAQMFLFSMEDDDKKTELPLKKDGISYSKTASGYRAEFTDKDGQQFALETEYGGYGEYDACCAAGNCEAIDIEPCN